MGQNENDLFEEFLQAHVNIIGTIIRDKRKARGLSLEDLADEVGISPAALLEIETGQRRRKPPEAQLKRFATVLAKEKKEKSSRWATLSSIWKMLPDVLKAIPDAAKAITGLVILLGAIIGGLLGRDHIPGFGDATPTLTPTAPVIAASTSTPTATQPSTSAPTETPTMAPTGSPTAAITPTGSPTLTPTSKPFPTPRPTSTGVGDPNSTPAIVGQLMIIREEVDDFFWETAQLQNQALDIPYYVILEEGETACGQDEITAPIFCRENATVYVNPSWLEAMSAAISPAVAHFLVAHAWAQAVEEQLGFYDDPEWSTVELELSADCLAGAYVWNTRITGITSEEAVTALMDAFVVLESDWGDSAAIVELGNRETWFTNGYLNGAYSCGIFPRG